MRKKLFWIATALMFLVFATEDWAFYRPGIKRLTHLNETIGKSQNQILGYRISAKRLQKIKELITQNSVQGQPGPDRESFTNQSLARLTAILEDLDIELLSMKPGETRQENLFVVSPFEIELRCGYHQFKHLLEAIESSHHFIVIREFELSVIESNTLVKLFVEVYLHQEGL
jgi:hypothetical protein